MIPADNQIERIRVVNHNDFPISDRFDGIPWVLRPGESIDLPLEVATHILGYPGDVEVMYRHMARRWGWNLPKHMVEDEKGVPLWWRQCERIQVSVEHFELRRVTDPKAPIRADDDGEESMRPVDERTETIAERKKARKARNTYRKQRSPEQRERMSVLMKERWEEKHRKRETALAAQSVQPQQQTEPSVEGA